MVAALGVALTKEEIDALLKSVVRDMTAGPAMLLEPEAVDLISATYKLAAARKEALRGG